MASSSPDQLKAQYQRALQLQQTDPKAAFNIYKSILKANPRIAEVYYQIARIQIAGFAFEPALDALKKAEALKPNEPAIWEEIVNATIGLSDPKETETVRKVLSKTKLNPKTKNELRQRLSNKSVKSKLTVSANEKDLLDTAVNMLERGELDSVITSCQAAEKKFPKNASFNLILATAQYRKGQLSAAEKNFKTAIRKNSNYAEAYAHYGGYLVRNGRHLEARQMLETALKLAPNLLAAQLNMAQALAATDSLDEATRIAKQAAKLNPKDPESAFILGLMLENQSNHAAALEEFQRSLELGNTDSSVYHHIGIAFSELRQFDEAETNFKKAIEIDPRNSNAEYRLGTLYQTKGQFDLAEPHIRRAITLDPTQGEYYRSLTTIKKLDANDDIVGQMKQQFSDKSLTNSARRRIGFALAKVMEDNKLHDQVFTYLKPANDLMGEEFPYDIQERFDFVDKVKEAFHKFDLKAQMSKGTKGVAPIFVTGMPRSGTTLVEQIIASHSLVEGAGEVSFVADAAVKRIEYLRELKKTANDIKPADLKQLGSDIQEHLWAIHPNAKHITDKSIQTYTMLPLLKAALPDARFIVVRRDPRDNLFSIYKNQFVDGTHTYAYDLKTLGAYYNLFDDLIAHWRSTFPDAFYEIHYEDLIADPETEARKLIDAAGLDWQDACLEFHKNKREVKTLSAYQVRQPIYKSSVKAWEHYKEDLKPLFEALK